MKKLALSLITLLALSGTAWAQDDVYFVPSKKALQQEQQERQRTHPRYSTVESADAVPYDGSGHYDDWADGRFSSRDVDEYNRHTRRQRRDTLNNYREEEADQQTMTGRIVRFRSPRGVIVASPYYYDYYYDLAYYDPWFSDWGWSGWYGWYDPWYYGVGWFGWNSPWRYSCYSPWSWNAWYSPWYTGWGWSGYYGWTQWGWGGYWNHPYSYYGYAPFHSSRGAYYSETRGSNRPLASRGGSFPSRGGNFTRNNGYSARSGYTPSYNNGNRDYFRSSNNAGVSRRGSLINTDRSRSNYSAPTQSRSNSYSPSRSNNYAPPTRNYQPSNSSSFGSGSTNSRSIGGFSGGSSRGGGFSGGGSSRGSVISGRR